MKLLITLPDELAEKTKTKAIGNYRSVSKYIQMLIEKNLRVKK
ncbi:MAG: hypothetical protein WCW13_05715 [archaeon]|jgi:hypothetical protein